MSEEVEDLSQGQEPQDNVDEVQSGTSDQGEQQEKPGGAQKGGALDGLPAEFAWVKKELDDARQEAARYRTQRSDLQKQLENSKSLEEFEALAKESSAQQKELERELDARRLVSEHGLMASDVDLLLKVKADAMEDLASTLAERVRPPRSTREPQPVGGGQNAGARKSGAELWREHRGGRSVTRPWG